MNKLITVIVPVYNVEKYLCSCIDSILEQLYEKFELILINDGSTDRSGNICDQYALKDHRIKVIHQKNNGLSAARNTGIFHAMGEYVTFIDSDDCVAPNYLSLMWKAVQNEKSDLVICSFLKISEAESPEKMPKKKSTQVLTKEKAIEKMLLADGFDVNSWGKLYKKTLFQGISYPEGKLYEDLGTTYKLIDQCQKPVYVPQKLYYYRMRKESIMDNRKFDENVMQAVAFNKEIVRFVKKKYPNIYEAAVYRFFCSNRRALHMAILTRGYWREKKEVIVNLAGCRKIVLKKEKETLKNKSVVFFATGFAWILGKGRIQPL